MHLGWFVESHQVSIYCVYNPKKKNSLTKNLTFLNKLYGKQSKVDKPVIITTSYEDNYDNDDKVSTNNDNNNNTYNVVSDSESEEEINETFLTKMLRTN